jgi:uncharacterized protein (UPF0335 family)
MNIEEKLERFGKADESTGEIVVDQVAMKKFFVEKVVYLLREQDNLREDVKTVLDDAKDAGLDKKLIKNIADNVFKNELDAKIAELQAIEVEIANLYEGDEE